MKILNKKLGNGNIVKVYSTGYEIYDKYEYHKEMWDKIKEDRINGNEDEKDRAFIAMWNISCSYMLSKLKKMAPAIFRDVNEMILYPKYDENDSFKSGDAKRSEDAKNIIISVLLDNSVLNNFDASKGPFLPYVRFKLMQKLREYIDSESKVKYRKSIEVYRMRKFASDFENEYGKSPRNVDLILAKKLSPFLLSTLLNSDKELRQNDILLSDNISPEMDVSFEESISDNEDIEIKKESYANAKMVVEKLRGLCKNERDLKIYLLFKLKGMSANMISTKYKLKKGTVYHAIAYCNKVILDNIKDFSLLNLQNGESFEDSSYMVRPRILDRRGNYME